MNHATLVVPVRGTGQNRAIVVETTRGVVADGAGGTGASPR